MVHKLEIRPAKPAPFTDQYRPRFYPIEMFLDGLSIADKVAKAEVIMEAGCFPILKLEIPCRACDVDLDVLLNMEDSTDEEESQSPQETGNTG